LTKLLLRLFVKENNATAIHSAVGRLAGVTGIVCNILLFTVKLIAGLLSGAVSIIADALNNLSDAASSIVTLLGFQLARRPADHDHPYGHARYEYLSGLAVAFLILVIGVELVESAIVKIWNPSQVDFSIVTVLILLCAIGIKLWMSLFFSTLGKKIGSTALKATAVDSRNDVIATTAVLLGCLVERWFSINVDGYIGLAVAFFILYSGVQLARETISPILGQRADTELTDRISNLIQSYDKVLGVHDLLVHDYGPGQCFASVHVEISAQEDPLVCHDIIDCIECDVLEKLNVHLVIHYDPVLENDEEWARMRKIVEGAVTHVDSRLSVHDFRIVRGSEQPKLVFDLTVPYSVNEERKELRQAVEESLLEKTGEYTTVIHFDNA